MTLKNQLKIIGELFLKFYNNPAYVATFSKKIFFWITGTDRYVKKYQAHKIASANESLNILMKSNKSFVRFGDGEMDLMLGSSIYFDKWHQTYDPNLAKRLADLFNHENIYVGLMKQYLIQSDKELKNKSLFFIWVQTRYALHKYLNFKQKYLDGLVFRENKNLDIAELFNYLKKYTVVLVTSQKKSYDLLAPHINKSYFVQAPISNAWQSYDQLVSALKTLIKNHKLQPKNTLFLLSIGPTAKPLVVDITELGYRAWDSGHFFQMYCTQLELMSKKTNK